MRIHFVLVAILASILSCWATHPLYAQSFDKLVTQAIAAQETGEWSLALNYYLQARELEPRNSIVLRNIGVAYSKMGMRVHAEIWLRAALAAGTDAQDRDSIEREADRQKALTLSTVRKFRDKGLELAAAATKCPDFGVLKAITEYQAEAGDVIGATESAEKMEENVACAKYAPSDADASRAYNSIAAVLAASGDCAKAGELSHKAKLASKDPDYSIRLDSSACRQLRALPFGIQLSPERPLSIDQTLVRIDFDVDPYWYPKSIKALDQGAIAFIKQREDARRDYGGMLENQLYMASKEQNSGWQLVRGCELGGWFLLAQIENGDAGCPYVGTDIGKVDEFRMCHVRYTHGDRICRQDARNPEKSECQLASGPICTQSSDLTWKGADWGVEQYFPLRLKPVELDDLVVRNPSAFLEEVGAKKPKDAGDSLMQGARDLSSVEARASQMERLWRDIRAHFGRH